ncbi:MAG: glycosyltransferase family 2 protein [Candidatus Latescibacteria bacterium]|nr:glycosyltransferase family 2 protein [Candidatus Latescibacterota bacterium]
MPTVSVIVVNHNTRDLLRDCLRSVRADADDLSVQTIVVDNASSDGSAAMVQAEFPGVHLIENPSNLGFSKANNAGLQASSSPYALLLNSDARLCPGALQAMVSFIEARPDVGILGPGLLNEDGSLQLSCGIPPTVWTEVCNKLLLHIPFPFFKMGDWTHDQIREVGWVTGACLLARRTMLDRIGLLDEGMFMYYEDLDLCFRARGASWKICYVPDAQVVHLGGATSRRAFGPMLVASGRSSFYFFRKHYGDGAVRLLRLITLPEMALRSALWGTLALFSLRRRAEARERLCAYRTILWRTLTDRSYWRPA